MASLINQAFQNAKNENRPALLTYTVAGDNTKKKSLEILESISNFISAKNIEVEILTTMHRTHNHY